MTTKFDTPWSVECKRRARRAVRALLGILVASSFAFSAQEKGAGATEPGWEYCHLQMGSTRLEQGNAIGTALITYATDEGGDSEAVEFVRPFPPEGRSAPSFEIYALRKAVSQLGKRGWELIMVTSETPENWRLRTYFFKRRLK